jgi:4-amino-4-deoxy-L-arabinose transferase-like glycosyltransferase
MKKRYCHYLPITLIIVLGFLIGGYLSFAVHYLNAISFVENPQGRLMISLYGVGMLGATTYCAEFWSKDIDEVVYENESLLPHFFDFFGYLTLIMCGGITGVILFLLVKTGIGVSTTSEASNIALTGEASVVFAYIGGLFHFRVKRHLKNIIDKMFKESKADDKKDVT